MLVARRELMVPAFATMELPMQESRRSLLRTIASAAAAFSMAVSVGRGQDPFPKAPPPMRPGDDEQNRNPNAKSPAKVLLEENQKDIRKNIEKLYELALQLKEQVEKTDATTVLSLAMVKKAEEIEKLARQIKDRAKG
jgi:hypothetical protein